MHNRSKFWMIPILGAIAVGCGDGAEPGARPPSPPGPGASAEAPSMPNQPSVRETEMGEATYYADVLDRQRTASGEILNQDALVAAHRRFPFGTILRVTNLENDRTVRVRVIDRGPFGAPREGVERVIDLSRRAADRLDFLEEGSTPVRVEVVQYGDGIASES